MNTKSLKFTMMFVFPFLLLSCGKNETDNNSVIHDYRISDVLYAKNSKLKYVYHQDRFYSEYKNDELGRVSRINYGAEIYAYEIYQYNTKGELGKIYSYYLENPPILGHTYIIHTLKSS